jgi:hypothetical protein
MEAKVAEMPYAIGGLSVSHPNKRGKLSFLNFKMGFQKISFVITSKRE